MVKGIESFRTKFMSYADCYTVIGGAACDILMSEEDVPFRATKDIDMIATDIGPGSFTGIRACVTVARVLAQQLNIKAVGVSSLEILSLKIRLLISVRRIPS